MSLTKVNDLSISASTTVYLIIDTPVWTTNSTNNNPYLTVSLKDFGYSETVNDGTAVYSNIYSTNSSDLGSNINATLDNK